MSTRPSPRFGRVRSVRTATSAGAITTKLELPSAHITTAARLHQLRPWIIGILALALVGFSALGSVFAIQPDLSGEWNAITLRNILIALLWQSACSAVQYVTCRYWRDPLYLIALTLSVGPSIYGYYPKIAVPLANVLTDWFGGTMLWVAVVLMTIALILADILPERIFIKH